jgi:hypothetical protein
MPHDFIVEGLISQVSARSTHIAPALLYVGVGAETPVIP